MTKEEAEAKGLEWHDTKHSMKRRSPWHDYWRKGTYMITIVVEGRKPVLGRLMEDRPEYRTSADTNNRADALGTVTSAATISGASAPVSMPVVSAHIELTTLGKTIQEDEIQKISRFYPMVEIWKLCIMPDHIHMILRIKEDMAKDKHLGQVIAGFKGGCSKAAQRLGIAISPASANDNHQSGHSENCDGWSKDYNRHSPLASLFEQGYNDKILLRDEQLDNWKHYLDDNPRRLIMKRHNPQLFTVLHDIDIAERHCQMVGNRFLLDIPDKVAVIVHRHYTDEENIQLRTEWLACGERGGVLVSAAISQKEKDVMREAMNRGYNIILLRENGFPALYKPSGESFDACASGRLLQISPWEHHMERKTITRSQCLELNELAERIAENNN